MKLSTLLFLLVTALWLDFSEAAITTPPPAPCTTKLFESNLIPNDNIRASSEKTGAEASRISKGGWCANSTDIDTWVEITFPQPFGVKGLITGPPKTSQAADGSFPINILVQYIPTGGTTLQDFPTDGGKLVLHYNQSIIGTIRFNPGLAMDKIRFKLGNWSGDPCMTLEILGCPISELCQGGCGHGHCAAEATCICSVGFTGSHCEKEDCVPVPLGMANGSIGSDMITVSSEDGNSHGKDEIRNNETANGWCPLTSDVSPWVKIQLTKPMAVSVFQFRFPIRVDAEDKMYMKEFELKYISPSDSSRTLRTFAKNIPAMNGTHYFDVTTIPSVVTNTIWIGSDAANIRACFKLEIKGCDPKSLCSDGWCENGGSCMGENVCACELGFFGDRCHETKADIKSTNLAFQKIENNVIHTAAISFLVTGHVILVTVENSQAVMMNGTNSSIQLNQSATSTSCLSDIDNCKSGFTYGIDINFKMLLNNTFIISSGGNLPDHKGIALYYTSNTLMYIVSTNTHIWQLHVPYKPVFSVWQHFEITWSKNLGLGLFLDGHLLGTHGRPATHPASKTLELCLGCSHTATHVEINMMIKEFHTWSLDRTELVNAGIKKAPVTTTTMGVTSVPTTQQRKTTKGKATTTKQVVTTLPSSTTAHATTRRTSIAATTHAVTVRPTTPTAAPLATSTATPSTPSTTASTMTTEQPVIEHNWNLTYIRKPGQAHGNKYTVTVHGGAAVKDGGIEISKSSQYIDFGTHSIECLINPSTCTNGVTLRFKIKFNKLEENTYLLTSGGERPDGIGLAMVYVYGRIQFVLSTNKTSWFASCGGERVTGNGYHVIMLSWYKTSGLYVYVNNRLVASAVKPIQHTVTTSTDTHAYFGKSLVSTTVQVNYIVQTFIVWHARLEILIHKGICKPPITDKPTTTTSMATTSTSTLKTTTPSKVTTLPVPPSTCPVGCVSIVSQPTTTSQPAPTKTRTSKPSATPTTTIAPPLPNTAVPTTKPATPSYNEKPRVHPITKDGQGYIACTFAGAAQPNVELVVSLVINGEVVLENTVTGSTGITMFAVAQIDENLYNTKIQCSISGRYVGSNFATQTTYSNVLVPRFEVSPSRLIVTEGQAAGHVTVNSTAPPQFFCGRGQKGECQIHVTGTFHYDRHDKKCGNKVIAQAVVESTTPPHYAKPICGFPLTSSNWDILNTISVKATLDGRRDGDHTTTLTVQAHVYNQPTATAITVRPVSFTVGTVAVTSKDNYHRASICKSLNDPHMTTFDGQRYNNMHAGEYVLYRHRTMPFEVRANYQKCSSRSHATCNCAVSIKAGDDVITVTGCQATTDQGRHGHGHHGHGHHGHHDRHDTRQMTLQIYKHGELTPGTVIRRYGCGQKYEIELPTGTLVTVQQSYKPFINIWIKASGPDWGHTTGLCGSFDGNRRNDLQPSTERLISLWKVDSQSTFFHGVSESTETVGTNYCSCVQGKDSICSYGLGAITCEKSRYDITEVLLRQAMRPANTRHRRAAEDNATAIVDVFQTDVNVTEGDATKFCNNAIMNSTVTESCRPIMTSNVSQQIDNCVHDYMATGSEVWAQDAIRDIAVDCIEEANELTEANNSMANITVDIPYNIEDIMANMCLENCGQYGVCSGGICQCLEGYSGISCDISKASTPTVSTVPQLCDISLSTDCSTAIVDGDNFVNSIDLLCHYQYITIGEAITTRGQKSTVPAVYISLTRIACTLPAQDSAYIHVSNDGQTESDQAAVHVVYTSLCHYCSVDLNATVPAQCTRKDGICVIGGVCHAAGDVKVDESCLICRPDASADTWSPSSTPVCIGKPIPQSQDSDDMDGTRVIILAVVCAVLGAVLVIIAIYIIRLRCGKGKKKMEAGRYEVTPSHGDHTQKASQNDYDSLHVKQMDNPAYSHL